jgi:AraC-like DNA-binding protein
MALPPLVFGWRTAVLALANVQMLLIAVALLRTLPNRTANRCLGALLLVLTGVLTPFAIGFAGFYDRYPWLSFAPFAVPLAVGPLLYFYAHALARGTLPARPGWHLAPALLQFGYQAASFCLPLEAKHRWDAVSTPFVEPLVALGTVAGLAAYCRLSLRLLRDHRAALAQQRSDDHRFGARWLSRAVGAMLVLLAAWAGYHAWDRWVAPLDYFGVLGLYLIIAAIGCYLAVEGWRHANLPFVLAAPTGPASPAAAAAGAAPATDRNWRALAERWAAQTRAAHWHQDPELSLAALARLLGTNSTHLSRSLNEGLGLSFSSFIAGLRCETVAAALRAGRQDELLDLALEAGFGSKASFNRAFQAAYGQSPSAYRRAHGSDSA